LGAHSLDLSAKHDLALAALDMESKVQEVALSSGMAELKRRLEVLLGAPADAPVDESEKQRNQLETDRLARRARMAEASGQPLTAAFALLEEMIPNVSQLRLPSGWLSSSRRDSTSASNWMSTVGRD